MKIDWKEEIKPTPKIFPLAVAIGMITFLLNVDNPGGMSGIFGFLSGFMATIVLYFSIGVLLIIVEHYSNQRQYSSIHPHTGASKSITIVPSIKDKVLTIQIHFDDNSKSIELSIPSQPSEKINLTAFNE